MTRSANPPIFADIQTARLDLIPVTTASLVCQQQDTNDMRKWLGTILHAAVPAEWPPEHWEPHVFEYLLALIAKDPEAEGWCRYIAVRDKSRYGRTLIGSFGSGFPKPETQEAEIGYGLLPKWQRNGFVVEAVEAMLPWLRSRRQVKAFVAQTFPHLYGSLRVLEKTGFKPAGLGYEDGAMLFRKRCEPAD
jgi:RimJ/RimL family protein N-acetyltransferase